MGLVCGGLHALGPDHLATLVTFSALMKPTEAAKVGASWGVGHCFGVVMIGVCMYVLGSLLQLHMEGLEHTADYVIGASMILVALYFVCREDKYITIDADGEEIVNGCHCCAAPSSDYGQSHGDHDHGDHDHGRHDHEQSSCCHEHGHHHKDHTASPKLCNYKGCCDEETHCAHETTPLIVHDAVQDRGGKSAAVGFLQGMCCPMGLVQVSYLAGQSAFDTAVFVFVCVAVVIMGTALVSALWAALTRSSMGQTVTPRIMYRASCFLAFACGVLWITANFFHILHKVNYAEHEAMSPMGPML